MTENPWFWLIAGPNGSGKTTLAGTKFSTLRNINADAEAQRLAPDKPGSVALTAGRNTIAATMEALAGDNSFTVETTLAGKMHLGLIRKARKRGWHVGLAYIGVSDSDAALARVQERYRRGGHNVPPADVHRRYRRSMANLPKAIRLTDTSIVYDNTSDIGMKRTLEVQQSRVTYVSESPPQWLRNALNDFNLAADANVDSGY